MGGVSSGRRNRWLIASLLAGMALFIPASPVSAAEHVLDGGLDQVTTCVSGDCSNPVWAEGRQGDSFVGPICQAGVGSCGFFEGPGNAFASSPPSWLQMGGETKDGASSWFAQQVVSLPAAPMTLRFSLMTRDSNVDAGTLVVKIGSAPVFAVAANAPGFASYAPVSVDVSGFGGGLRELRFEVSDTQAGSGSSDSFNIDDVSITDQPPGPAATTTPAKKKKCKKKKKNRASAAKKKKCKKKRK
jgi:hypothetical protein